MDALNGEPLAFVNEKNKDNALKNFTRPITALLDGVVYINGEKKHLNIPRYAQIREDASLQPTITVTADSATIDYPHLVANGNKTDIAAKVHITIPEGECKTYWTLTLDNPTDLEVESVTFPQLNGMWLGDSWEDDILVWPKQVGEKVKNPTAALSATPVQIHWKWQEYLYAYKLNASCGVKDDRGVYQINAVSMHWCATIPAAPRCCGWISITNQKTAASI